MVDVLARAWVQYTHPEDCVDGRHPRELLGNGPMGKLLVQVVRQNRQGFSGKLCCLGRCWTGCFRFWLFERECEMEMEPTLSTVFLQQTAWNCKRAVATSTCQLSLAGCRPQLRMWTPPYGSIGHSRSLPKLDYPVGCEGIPTGSRTELDRRKGVQVQRSLLSHRRWKLSRGLEDDIMHSGAAGLTSSIALRHEWWLFHGGEQGLLLPDPEPGGMVRPNRPADL